MTQYYSLLTKAGATALANAQVVGGAVSFTHLAIGDGNGGYVAPDETRTALVREVHRVPVSSVRLSTENPNWIIVEASVPAAVGGWTIRELGVITSAGVLFAHGAYPQTYKPALAEGSGVDLVLRFICQVSNTGPVSLTVDPNVAIASVPMVLELMESHDLNPRAHGRGVWKVLPNGTALKTGERFIPDNELAAASYPMPTAPNDGDWFEWKASQTPFSTNYLRLQMTDKTIHGQAEDLYVRRDRFGGRARFSGPLDTWLIHAATLAGVLNR